MKDDIREHEQKEHGERCSKCSSCEATTETNLKSKRHKESVHQSEYLGWNECEYRMEEIDK